MKLIKVVIRHINWEAGKSIGEFPPSEVEFIVELIKEHGAFTPEGNEELSDSLYFDSRFLIDDNCFEIIVE